jgi:3-oxoacyl-[acyl-carrier protein] reductase
VATADREVVLVTGSRSGIGRHLSEHFVREGAAVEGCSRSEPDWELEGYHHHVVDVGDEEAVCAMIRSIRRRHGRLDVIINNAAVASMNHSLLTPGSTVDAILTTNVKGVFSVSREGAKLMRKRGYGRIVNIGTTVVPLRVEGEAVYAASKGAVETLTRILARELAEFGITCNVVAPTIVDTDIIRGVPQEKLQQIVDRLAIKRLATFADVTNAVDFFVRRESEYVTGQVLYLGGA